MMSAIAVGLPEPPRVFAIDADGPLSPGVEPFEPFFDADRQHVVESARDLYDELVDRGVAARVIGGAHVAVELDAAAAIDEATRLALAV